MAAFCFDWEYSSKGAPLFTDLFHRVLMPARLVLRHAPDTVLTRLLGLHEDRIMGPVIQRYDVERLELAAYLLLYLIRLAMREAAADGTVSEFLLAIVQHSIEAFPQPA